MNADLRHRHVVDSARLRDGHCVLEIGPGHGLTLELMAAAVGAGQVCAVDRSPKMVAAATRRNQRYVDAGRVHLRCGRVQDCDFDDASFDRVVALRVREVWDDPEALPLLARWLRADGLLCLGIDAPQRTSAEQACRRVAAQLTDGGFRSVDVTWAQDQRTAAVTAHPPDSGGHRRARASAGTS